MTYTKKAIITGASSGIGRALAAALSNEGYALGLMARRSELLEILKKELPAPVWIVQSDFENPERALADFNNLCAQMGAVDLVVLNAGVNHRNLELDWEPDRNMLQVNVASFVALANETMRIFLKQGAGHLTGISSIAGVRGSGKAPVYSATKAFLISYLEGLRQRVQAECPRIYVTDVRPGYVDTEMIRRASFKFWVATPEKAARQIVSAIRKKRKALYVTRRWAIAAFFFRWLPDWFYDRIYRKIFKKIRKSDGS